MRHFVDETKGAAPGGYFRSATGLTTEVYGLNDWLRIAEIYAQLAEVSQDRSFYLSVEWISAWLEVFGESIHHSILVFEEEGQAVGACLLTRLDERRGPFLIRQMYLNGGGEPESKRTLMEFNSILCRGGTEDMVAEALGRYAISQQWDEFAIQGMALGEYWRRFRPKHFRSLRHRSACSRRTR